MSHLILVRHGESTWNARGVWTGWNDVPLSQKGKKEAKNAGEKLRTYLIDIAFTSVLIRAKDTLTIILSVMGKKDIPIESDIALNERDYGDYAGKNKWKIKEAVGEAQFLKIRRGWATDIPNGESLKQVYERVIPYFTKRIVPEIKKGKHILISAHGNSLRALVKYLENISDEQIPYVEIPTGEPWIYNLDGQMRIIKKIIL